MKGRRAVLVGAYPPPYGGVSTHIERFSEYLRAKGIEPLIIDVSRVKKYQPNITSAKSLKGYKWILNSRESVIHFHLSDINVKKTVLLLVCSVFCRFVSNPIIVTFHSEFRDPRRLKWLCAFQKLIPRIVAVGPHIRKTLLESGFDEDRVVEIPAFIAPRVVIDDIEAIPESIQLFVNNHSPVLAAYAHDAPTNDGNDTYGIDMFIELCEKLRNEYPNTGFILSIQMIRNPQYLHDLESLIEKKGLGSNIMISKSRHCQFYPILMKSSIYVRPTNTDGDAVSIREALMLGIPAIASDVVPRPRGTILFRTRDFASLLSVTLDTLKDREHIVEQLRSIHFHDYAEELYEEYVLALTLECKR